MEYHLDSRQQHRSHQTVSGRSNAALYPQRRMQLPSDLEFPLFRHLQGESTGVLGDGADGDDSCLRCPFQVGEATTAEEALAAISSGIRLKLSQLLSINADDFDTGKSMSSNGMGSLVATKFRTWPAKTLKPDVPMLVIMGTSSIPTFSGKVVGVSKLVQVSFKAQT